MSSGAASVTFDADRLASAASSADATPQGSAVKSSAIEFMQ